MVQQDYYRTGSEAVATCISTCGNYREIYFIPDYDQMEIDDMRAGWFNPRKIDIEKKFTSNPNRVSIRNSLPYKFRINVVSEQKQ